MTNSSTNINADDDFELMMNSALRYALGRHTYIVKVTADYLSTKLKIFSKKTLSVMHEDLMRYFDDIVPLGNEFECDINTWRSLFNKIKDELKKESRK